MLLLFVWNNNTRGNILIRSSTQAHILDQPKRKSGKSSKNRLSKPPFWINQRENQEKAPKTAAPSPCFGPTKEKSKKKLQNLPLQASILDQPKKKARKSSKIPPCKPTFWTKKREKQEKAPNPTHPIPQSKPTREKRRHSRGTYLPHS